MAITTAIAIKTTPLAATPTTTAYFRLARPNASDLENLNSV